MTDFYNELGRTHFRFGRTADFPETPPDKSAGFWNLETGKVYAVNDLMEWVLINPDPEPFPDEIPALHVRSAIIAISAYPSGSLFVTPPGGAFITEVRIDVTAPFEDGLTCTIGDPADVDRLMESDSADLQTVGTYTTYPQYGYGGVEGINVYLSFSPAFGLADVYIFYEGTKVS